MTLRPLPVSTRVYGGEGVTSYSHRHAARNLSQIRDVEAGVRQRGIGLGKAREGHASPERMDVWRQLGGLHPSSFKTPTRIDGDPVTDRRLCLRCTRGHPAVGRVPHMGLVCLRHKRWLGSAPQLSLNTYPPALTAERHFRTHLAAHRVLFDSFAMELGQACATPPFIGTEEIEQRRQHTGIDTVAALIYPEQVKFARLLTSQMFLDYVTDPGRQARDRRDRITHEATKILPTWDDAESWRVTERIWHVERQLTERRREVLLWGTPVRDAQYNLLRFIDLRNPVIDGNWDDYAISPTKQSAAVTDHHPA
jgi:hypothetical protein